MVMVMDARIDICICSMDGFVKEGDGYDYHIHILS
jgi:hypothetical protein